MSNSKSESRRERRIAKRRAQILEAAVRVFAEKGFRNATIHDVAEAADIADGTLYNYFKNKNDLLISLINQLSAAEQQGMLLETGSLAETIAERMRRVHTQYDAIAAVLPEILGTPELREHYYEKFVRPVAAAIEHELGTLLAQSNQEPMEVQLAARILLSTVMGFQVLLILGDPLILAAWDNPDELAKVWAQFVAYGLR